MSAQASAAVTPDVALKGDNSYFRAGVYSRNFKKNETELGRLGNENDNWFELAPQVTLAEVDGVEYRLVSSIGMSPEGNNGYGNDFSGERYSSYDAEVVAKTQDMGIYLTQAYIKVNGLLDSDKEASIWVGRKYIREDSHIVDNKWRDVSGTSVGIENLSLGLGKLRTNWTRRDSSTKFDSKFDGYETLPYGMNVIYDTTNPYNRTVKIATPSRITNNIFDVAYRFPVASDTYLDLGYTLVAPQRYAAEYSNYGFKVKDEIGNSHLFTSRLDTKLFGNTNNTTVLRFVKGSTAEGGFTSHTYTVNSQDDSSYTVDLIDFGCVNFTDNFNMLYHTWFNFSKLKNSIGTNDNETTSRSFQVVLRPQYKLTKMTRLVLETAMFTQTESTVDFKGDDKSANKQGQKLTLAYAITPDAGFAMSRPEIRFFGTYKHYNHEHDRVGTYETSYALKNKSTSKIEDPFYDGRKTEFYFGVQAESWF